MMMKSAFNIQLDGYVPANRDAVVSLKHESTGAQITRKPFLDGSLLVRDIEPGFYEMEVRHPNLVNPIEKRRIRLFPQPTPTRVRIPVPAELFRDSPIRDTPDADLGPIQQQSTDVRDRLQPISGKSAGEAIRAADWNTLVASVQDLSSAVLELTNLVSPQGHDHAEIAEKIDEVQGNIQRFGEAFGRSLIELRREIEMENLKRNAQDVLDRAGANADRRERFSRRFGELDKLMQSDTAAFTQKLSRTGQMIVKEVGEMAVEQGPDADDFLTQPDVKSLAAVAQHYSESGPQIKAESELLTYQKTTTAAGGAKMTRIFGR